MKLHHALLIAALGSLGLSSAEATGLFGTPPGQQRAQSEVLAQGAGGALTQDAVAAYLEALEFCLGQVGAPQQFGQQQKGEMTRLLAQGFAALPLDVQQGLAAARGTWEQYRQAWPSLSLEQKREFAYEVLAIAYGEEAAAQSVGYGGGSASSAGGSGGGDFVPQPTLGEDYYRSYEGGIPMGDGSYSYDN